MTTKEPQKRFDVRLEVPAGRLGPLLALLDNQYDVTAVRLIKEVEAGRNTPKGTMRTMVVEILKRSGGAIHAKKLNDELVALGFTKGSVYTGVRKLINDKFLQKNAQGFVKFGAKGGT